MRIIHCADLHLDSGMDTNLTPQKAEQRRHEIQKTFEKMVDYAVDMDVRVILMAGDLFDSGTGRNHKIKERVLDVIRSAPGIDFLYLRGNHDADEEFCAAGNRPDNLKLFGLEWTSYRYGNICITGKEQYDDVNLTGFDDLSLEEKDINICVLHGQVIPGRSATRAGDIPLGALKDKAIDYLALGHIHQYRKEPFDARGVYCYCGCLEGRGFDECGPKGAVLLEADEDGVTSEFVPFAGRCFHEVSVDISGAIREREIMELIEARFQGIPGKSLVKLELCGEINPELDVDIAYLENYFENRFFLLKVKDCTKMRICYEDYEKDISLKGEFIRQVRRSDLAEEDKERVLATGIRALMGREFGR